MKDSATRLKRLSRCYMIVSYQLKVLFAETPKRSASYSMLYTLYGSLQPYTSLATLECT